MNATLVRTFVTQRLASPLRLALVGMFFVFPLIACAFTAALAPAEHASLLFALVFAAGAIGQDVSSGVLTLTFARPVTRARYVVSRWVGATLLATAAGVLLLLCAGAVAAARGAPPGATALLAFAVEDALSAAAGAAVMIALSSLVGGLGDVGLYAIGFVTIQIGQTVAAFKHWTALEPVLTQLMAVLQPKPSLAWLLGSGTADWGGLVGVLSTTALGLAIAIAVTNRKELSYASS